MTDLAPCPFCGEHPDSHSTIPDLLVCSNLSCCIYGLAFTDTEWEPRPLEKGLLKEKSELEIENGRLCDEVTALVKRNDKARAKNAALRERIEALEGAVQGFVDWAEKYPSSRIFSHHEIVRIAAEHDDLTDKARALLATGVSDE